MHQEWWRTQYTVAKEVSAKNSAKSAEYINNSPPYFVYPSTTMHLRGSKGQDGCAAAVGHVEGCLRVQTNIGEVKVSQLKSSQTNEFAGHFSP
jgi:hypothetical protein